jgi:two-component system sensor histidine kinase KdpD
MQSSDKVMGVIAFRPNDERVILPGEYQFLASVAQVFASYLQRHFSDENAFKIKAHEDIEKTYKKALDVISLELKPVYSMLEEVLIDIKANLTLQSTFVGSLKTLQNCLTSISSIMDNASSMSYLSSSIINFKKEAFEARSMIFNVVEKMRLELLEFTLILDVKENLPDIIADKALIETCLFHFLKNASENAPYQTKIKIEANISGQNFIINVLDEGPGIPQDKLDEVFKKFFRLPGAKTPALGLGLSISKSIAAIHQGDVLLQNRIPRGLKVSLVIPYH